MPFRQRQSLHVVPYFRPAIPAVVLEDDKVVEKCVDTTEELPSPEDFQVDVLLQSRVPVKQVGTSIIKPGFAETQDFLGSFKPSEPIEPSEPSTTTTTNKE